MEFRQRPVPFQNRGRIVRPLIWPWSVKQRWLAAVLRSASGRTMQCVVQDSNPAVQFLVNPAKLAPPFQLIRGEAKPCQHGHQYQPIPELQPPFDGFEKFHPGNGARLWPQSQPRHVVIIQRVGNFGRTAAGASHTAALGDVNSAFIQCNSRGRDGWR